MVEISVIIPAYNCCNYLECCLNSIKAQTFRDFEVIIIDDGSTDSTANVALSFAESNANFIVKRTQNAGVSSARNTGLTLAKGKYVTFVDADDFLPPQSLKTLYAAIKKSGADVAIAENGYYKDGKSEQINCTDEYALWDNSAAINACLEDNPLTFVAWGKLYNRQFLGDVKFEVGRKINEDAFFVFECFEKCSFVAVTKATCYLYRLNESSSSNAKFSDKYFDILYFADKKIEIIKARHPQLINKAYNLCVKANMALLDKLCGANDKKYRQAEKASRKKIKEYKKYYIPSSKKDNIRLFFMLNLYPIYRLIQHTRLK